MTDKLMLPCDCCGTCSAVLIMEFEPYKDDPQEFFVEFFESVGYRKGIRDRLRVAWGVLRGKEPYMHCVAWTSPEQPQKLADFLNTKLGGSAATGAGGAENGGADVDRDPTPSRSTTLASSTKKEQR